MLLVGFLFYKVVCVLSATVSLPCRRTPTRQVMSENADTLWGGIGGDGSGRAKAWRPHTGFFLRKEERKMGVRVAPFGFCLPGLKKRDGSVWLW